jgi:hypothetical protein
VVPKAQLHNILYDDLMAEPVKAITDLYTHLGFEFDPSFRARIEAYFAANPRTNRPKHRYATGEQERIATERAHYQRYQSYFRVPSEL